jgi:hypothetical protein
MTIPSILDTPRSELPFPEVVDNSMVSAFKKCEGAGYYSYIENLSPTGTSVHLHAGGAFAYGIEHARKAFYVEGKPAEEAIGIGIAKLLAFYGDYECPPDSAKSALRMAGALEFYFDTYKLGSDYLVPWTDGANHGIEFSFSLPMSISHPVSGQPILYAGRFDMLGVDQRSGVLFVDDEKTATQLGTSWSNQWGLDSQFTGYCAGAKAYGKPVAGAIIRGVSILKTKYDTKEAVIYRSDWEIHRWWRETHKIVQRMIEIWRNGKDSVHDSTIEWKLDKSACGAYGGCAYQSLCNSPNPQTWKRANFEARVWHPMIHQEREAEVEALTQPKETAV